MANERQRQLMQEALDAELTLDALKSLREELDTDPTAAADFLRLRQVDQMLKQAPYERAPEQLALKIMARLAASMKPQEMSPERSTALALGLSLVMLVTMPLLIASVSLFMIAGGDASLLAAIIQKIVALLAVVVGMLDAIVQSAQNVVAESEAPMLLMALIPVTLFWLLKVIGEQEQQQDTGGI